MQSDPSIDVLGTALNYYIQQSNGVWVQPMQPACVALYLLRVRAASQLLSVLMPRTTRSFWPRRATLDE